MVEITELEIGDGVEIETEDGEVISGEVVSNFVLFRVFACISF